MLSSRKLEAAFRDSFLLLREFQWPLLGFFGLIAGGGSLYVHLAGLAGEPPDSVVEAAYHILGLVFLSPIEDFPETWYLQLFNFMIPLIGLSILAQGIADFSILFFNRRARGKEWEIAVASTYKDHVVVIGLGHLGYRVSHHLHAMDQELVAIELNTDTDLVVSVKALGVPVLEDDGAREASLTAAGIHKAASIILCTQNDGMNLQIALKARSLNPDIHVVVRIFDDDFARALNEQFGFQALSATASASPIFAASAVGVNMTRSIQVDNRPVNLALLEIDVDSMLVNRSVEEIEADHGICIVLQARPGTETRYHPPADTILKAADRIAVLGDARQINTLAHLKLKEE